MSPRIVLVGAGRSRQGLGPHYMRHLRAAGATPVAVVGRDYERTARAAAFWHGELGLPITAYVAVADALAATKPDGLVIASPIESHAQALTAALAARVPTLCEKPLLPPESRDHWLGLVAGFAAAAVSLREACQWPELLPELTELLPLSAPPRRFRLGLSPGHSGRAMLVDSLSHFLSLVQALVAVDATTEVSELHWQGRGGDSEHLTMTVTFAKPFAPVVTQLVLARHQTQPRPAWIEIDGTRLDRGVELPNYGIYFEGAGKRVSVRDPLARLVYRFVQCLRQWDPAVERTESSRLVERARLFTDLVESHDGR